MKRTIKISEFLKNQGLFSNDIKSRIKNGQIQLDGVPIKEDVEITFSCSEEDNEKGIIPSVDLGVFIFNIIKNNKEEEMCLIIMGVDAFIGEDGNLLGTSGVAGELKTHFQNFIFIKMDKKTTLVLTK